jgi:hypothetical protein
MTIVGLFADLAVAAVDPAAAIRPMSSATPSEMAYAALAARLVCLRNTSPPPVE